MRACIFSVIFAGLCALFGALAAPAMAQPYGPPDRDGVQPLDRLLPGIRRAHPGDFYDAEGPTYGPSGDPHYHLKWMTPDGRVIWYDTDARSGRVLRSSPGRDSFDGDHVRGYGGDHVRGEGDHVRGPGPNYGRSFDRDGPPPGYAPRFGRGGFGGAPNSYGGPRFSPRYAPGPSSGGWRGRGGGGGGGRGRH
jgi:hypothetical protein